MTQPLRTCIHTYDTPAAPATRSLPKTRTYCRHHHGYRARQFRLALARVERFDIKIPPLEDMYAVQSALSRIAEALAADMIDLKRAHAPMTVRLMPLNFHHHEMWQTNLYHSD